MSSEDNTIETDEVERDGAMAGTAPAGAHASGSAGDSADGSAEEAAGPPAGAGATLRAARERRRLTIDLVAAETRIPKRHLETIEAGDFEDLPSRTYAIGFARSYARVVGLDETFVANLVREEMGSVGPRYSSVGQGMEPGDPAKLPSRGLAMFGAIAALVLILGVITFAGTYYGAGEGPASLLDPGATENPEPQQAKASDAAGDAPIAPDPASDGQVVFTALDESGWVRFYERDGEILFEGVMDEGDTFAVPKDAEDPWINTGRASRYTITIGGQSVPVLSDQLVPLQAPVSAAALLERAEG